jgi:hypothetical protein
MYLKQSCGNKKFCLDITQFNKTFPFFQAINANSWPLVTKLNTYEELGDKQRHLTWNAKGKIAV